MLNPLIRIVPTVVFLFLSGCATIDFDYPKSESVAISGTGASSLGRSVVDSVAQHPGKSGFLPLADGVDALAMRLLLAEQAERSIDAQYFLIHGDLVGRVFIDALLRAADRGVRVRLLIDDVHTDGYDREMAALNAHENFEIRLFNPFAHRTFRALNAPSVGRVIRRMHNKSFTVDNQVTVLGGRNIGNEYFGASDDVSFGDLDVAAIGPVVKEVSTMFDTYWNHQNALPIPALTKEPDDPQSVLEQIRARFSATREEIQESRYAEAVRSSVLELLQAETSELTWAPYSLIYDSPDKSLRGAAADTPTILTGLRESIFETENELLIVTPYFVMRSREMDNIQRLRDRGVKVAVLTNSLASNNHTIAHSGYAPSRKRLLRMGVKIYEVRADTAIPGDKSAGSGTARTTLHAKAYIVDRRHLFVGSFNFNQRSENVDTEVGVIIDSPKLAAQFAEQFDALQRSNSYELFLNGEGRLRWKGLENGQEVVFRKEPQTSWWRRFSAKFLSILPIKSQL